MNHPIRRITLFAALMVSALIIMDSYVQFLVRQCPLGNTAKVNAVMSHELDAEVTVWGASTARVHFDTPMMEKKLQVSCFNVGMDGTPFQQYAGLLKEYVNYTVKGKVLVIAIDINGFGKREALYQGYGWLHYIHNENMYQAIKSIDKDLAFKSRFVPLYYLTTYDRRFLGRCFKWVYFSTDAEPELDRAGFHPSDLPWQPNQHRDYDKPFNLVLDKEVINSIREIIREAVKKGIQVAIVAPPCYSAARKLVLNLDSYERVLASFEGENVKVLNYLDSPICTEKMYFKDYTHLNAFGALKFTRLFAEDIRPLTTKFERIALPGK